MPTERACRRQWIGLSILRMLKIFSRDRQLEVEGDDIIVVVAAVRKKQTTRWRMHRCASRLCHNQLITNEEGLSFILLCIRHLSECLSLLLLSVVKTSTGSGSISDS